MNKYVPGLSQNGPHRTLFHIFSKKSLDIYLNAFSKREVTNVLGINFHILIVLNVESYFCWLAIFYGFS